MQKKSTQVAMGGVLSALSLLLMFMTGLVPAGTFVFPAAAGVLLMVIMFENGAKLAVLVYASVSILSLLIVPDKEAAIVFVFFFGLYPIFKEKCEANRSRILEYLMKFAFFNIMIISGYFIIINVLGTVDLLSDMGDFGQYTTVVFLLIGNGIFILYDIALTRYITIYLRWFRPKFLGH